MESIEFNAQIKIRKACLKKTKKFYFLNAVKFSCNFECQRCAHLNSKGRESTTDVGVYLILSHVRWLKAKNPSKMLNFNQWLISAQGESLC